MSLGSLFHEGGKGRVITLDAPYVLPEGMDLRGIAGVILKRDQNADTARALNAMTEEDFAALHKHSGMFDGAALKQQRPMGPRPPAPFNLPAAVMDELKILSAAFLRLSGAQENNIHFPSNRAADQFHIDGANAHASWRLTYAFVGAQSLWHNAVRTADTPVAGRGMSGGFPVLRDETIGRKGVDYFPSEGALMFLTHSPNGLFHKPPEDDGGRRFLATFDTTAPRRADCGLGCPFPCR